MLMVHTILTTGVQLQKNNIWYTRFQVVISKDATNSTRQLALHVPVSHDFRHFEHATVN